MEKKDLIKKEAEKTLQISDGIGKVETNPYLFSKIIDRIEETEPKAKRFNFKLAITVVAICLFTNLAVLFFSQDGNGASDSGYNNSDSVRTAQIKSFATEYSSINNFYFY